MRKSRSPPPRTSMGGAWQMKKIIGPIKINCGCDGPRAAGPVESENFMRASRKRAPINWLIHTGATLRCRHGDEGIGNLEIVDGPRSERRARSGGSVPLCGPLRNRWTTGAGHSGTRTSVRPLKSDPRNVVDINRKYSGISWWKFAPLDTS